MRLVVEVTVFRGAIPESRHRIQVAACDPDGVLTAATDDPDRLTTFRSAAKPFQLLPLVERGHAERWGWSDEQLAVMAASHTGSPYHVALVRGILERLGLDHRALACGFHHPIDVASSEHLRAHPGERSALYNNCSGKHAGMLCLAVSEGWPIEGYTGPDHPVQRLMRRTVAEVCGLAPDDLLVAVDGCSVSVFGLPLSRMARAYARLAAARPDGEARDRALHRVRAAMQAWPRAVGGPGRLSTALMEACRPRVVAKGGAEGLECLGLPERRLGLAVKCEDGQTRAMAPAVMGVLEHLGVLPAEELRALSEWRRPEIRNHANLEAGHLEAAVRVLTPAGT